jgi:hypothetical protein
MTYRELTVFSEKVAIKTLRLNPICENSPQMNLLIFSGDMTAASYAVQPNRERLRKVTPGLLYGNSADIALRI